jgi:hypothetical protein
MSSRRTSIEMRVPVLQDALVRLRAEDGHGGRKSEAAGAAAGGKT